MILILFVTLIKLAVSFKFDAINLIEKPYYIVTYRPITEREDDSYKYQKFSDSKCPLIYDTQPNTKYNFIKNCNCYSNFKYIDCFGSLSELPNIDFKDSNDWSLSFKKLSCNRNIKFYLTNVDRINRINIECSDEIQNFLNFDFSDTKYLTINYFDLAHNKLTNFSLDTPKETFFIKLVNLSSNYLTYFDNDKSILSADLTLNSLNSIDIDQQATPIKFNLSNNNFNRIPLHNSNNNTHSTLEILNLNNNYIKEVLVDNLASLVNLKELYLAYNQIETIEKGAFLTLINLKVLDLSFNKLKKLSRLSSQVNLEKLILNHNLIEHTTHLHITSNKLNKLKILNLNNNQLKYIENYTFGHLKNLLDLDLSYNQIEKIDVDAFHISNTSLYGPGLLEKIDLSNNALTQLKNNLFNYLTNLRFLKLNNNKLTNLSKLLFNGTYYLISLDLSLNQLETLEFLRNNTFLEKLRDLKISNNKLTSLKDNYFKSLKHLRHLDLSSNFISSISYCAFNGIQNTLTQLILNNNLIEIMNPCSLSLNFKHVRFVQILNNPIDCSSNCYLYYLVFHRPYSINYFGTECHKKDLIHHHNGLCNKAQYEFISQKCQQLFESNANCEFNDTAEAVPIDLHNHLKDIFAENATITGDKLKNDVTRLGLNLSVIILIFNLNFL